MVRHYHRGNVVKARAVLSVHVACAFNSKLLHIGEAREAVTKRGEVERLSGSPYSRERFRLFGDEPNGGILHVGRVAKLYV